MVLKLLHFNLKILISYMNRPSPTLHFANLNTAYLLETEEEVLAVLGREGK